MSDETQRERELSLNTAVTPYNLSFSLHCRPVGGEPIKAGT